MQRLKVLTSEAMKDIVSGKYDLKFSSSHYLNVTSTARTGDILGLLYLKYMEDINIVVPNSGYSHTVLCNALTKSSLDKIANVIYVLTTGYTTPPEDEEEVQIAQAYIGNLLYQKILEFRKIPIIERQLRFLRLLIDHGVHWIHHM